MNEYLAREEVAYGPAVVRKLFIPVSVIASFRTAQLKNFKEKSATVIDIQAHLQSAIELVKMTNVIRQHQLQIEGRREENQRIRHELQQRKFRLESIRNQMKSNIQGKINEARYFIDTLIMPSIAKLQQNAGQSLNRTLIEIDQRQSAVQEEINRLERQREGLEEQLKQEGIANRAQLLVYRDRVNDQLQKLSSQKQEIKRLKQQDFNQQMRTHVITTGLHAVSAAAAAAPFGFGIAAAVAATTAAGVAQGVSMKESFRINSLIDDRHDQMEGIRDKLFKAKNRVEGDVAGMLSILQDQIRTVASNVEVSSRLRNSLNSLSSEIRRQENADDTSLDEALSLRTRLMSILSATGESPNVQKLLKQCLKLVEVAFLSPDAYQMFKQHQAAFAEQMEDNEQLLEQLDGQKQRIHSVLIPIMRDSMQLMNNYSVEMLNSSRTKLKVMDWQIQSALKEAVFQVKQMASGLDSQPMVVLMVDRLQDAMKTITSIYDGIEQYKEKIEDVQFTAELMMPTKTVVELPDTHLIERYNKALMRINYLDVVTQYENARRSFRQWVFPFADKFINPVDTSMAVPKFSEKAEYVNQTVHIMTKMVNQLQAYKSSVVKHDAFLLNGDFNSVYRVSRPFFRWTYKDHKELIDKLLDGEEVVLYADIRQAATDAVKFTDVYLNFTSGSADKTRKLHDTLEHSQTKIHLTHLGNSYYRCGRDNYYVITTDSVEIFYSFERKADGVPVTKSMAYDKIRSGDYLLSPYTYWKVRLDMSDDGHSAKQFEPNIELSGFGSYMNAQGRRAYCSQKLNNYYARYDANLRSC